MSNDKIKSLQPQFVGKTELRVNIRRIGGNSKVMVTVVDYAPLSVNVTTSDRRSLKAATEAARKYPIASTDHTKLPMGSVLSKVTDPSTGKTTQIRVRSTAYIFSGVE